LRKAIAANCSKRVSNRSSSTGHASSSKPETREAGIQCDLDEVDEQSFPDPEFVSIAPVFQLCVLPSKLIRTARKAHFDEFYETLKEFRELAGEAAVRRHQRQQEKSARKAAREAQAAQADPAAQ
jgi:hypothetical protein